jgi:TPR repeat protein
LARCYFDTHDFKSAVEWWIAAANQGSRKAQMHVAQIYSEGKPGVPLDKALAAGPVTHHFLQRKRGGKASAWCLLNEHAETSFPLRIFLSMYPYQLYCQPFCPRIIQKHPLQVLWRIRAEKGTSD